MIYLKDILLETQIAHTQKSLQWVYHGYIAMTPKVMKQIMGDVPITTFHNLDWFAIKNQLPKVLGTKNQYQHTQVIHRIDYQKVVVFKPKVVWCWK